MDETPLVKTSLTFLQEEAELKFSENEIFRDYLRNYDGDLDEMVHELNDRITPLIDCTTCGNCCRSLMINVTAEEASQLSHRRGESLETVIKKFMERSFGGQLVINQIPCHFLSENKCTIYNDRFTNCREFPNLDKPGFRKRIFATLMHYGRCPIIYNVMEELKHRTNFVLPSKD